MLPIPCQSYNNYQHSWNTNRISQNRNIANIGKLRIETVLRSDASISLTPTKTVQRNELSQACEKQEASIQTASKAALWHRDRRREMIRRHGDTITNLESQRSLSLTLPILIGSNAILTLLSIVSGSFSMLQLFGTAYIFGSVLSLWQLQLLHEVLHGAMLGNGKMLHRKYSKALLFWCSFPCAFGYWLYMQYGHLSHHKLFGAKSLESVFNDSSKNLGDGDMLFVNHRMKLKGNIGPKIKLPWNSSEKEATPLSIGTFTFNKWKKTN